MMIEPSIITSQPIFIGAYQPIKFFFKSIILVKLPYKLTKFFFFINKFIKIKKLFNLLVKELVIVFSLIYHQKFTKYFRVKLIKVWVMKAGQNAFPR